MTLRIVFGLLAGLALIGAPAAAADKVKIGFIATMSGGPAALGRDLYDGFMLGVKHRDGRLGGLDTEVIVGDDQFKPDVGKQLAERMVKSDRVDIVTGVVFSHILLAMARPVLESETFLISANAGPSKLAGERCSPFFFNVAWQNDNTHEAAGQYVQNEGFGKVYLMAPNYPAGKDALAGFKRFYKGGVAGEIYTKLGQPDYAAELAELRAAGPDAVFVFYPGGMGVNFVKQYALAGLKGEIPLFGPSFTFDQTVLKAQGDAAVGNINSAFWSPDLDNDANRRFVADFEAAYGRIPSPYAAQAYDAAQLIDSALRAIDGRIEDKDAFREALRIADFVSVRGPFRFNQNHFPIQNFYMRQVIKDEQGRITNKLIGTVFTEHKDAYQPECGMTW